METEVVRFWLSEKSSIDNLLAVNVWSISCGEGLGKADFNLMRCDVGFPFVSYEYVLLPLVIKEIIQPVA